MSGNGEEGSLPLPSPAQIALALATVRSKPTDISIEEHLNNIRRCIVIGHARQGQRPPKHIDTLRFWKDAFLRSQQEKWKAHEEVSVLRRQTADSHGPTKTVTKRKADSNALNKANTHSKRKKTERETPDQDAPYRNAGREQADHPAIQRVLQGILALLKPGSSSNAAPLTLLSNMQHLCRALRDCLNSVSTCNRPVQDEAAPLSLAEVCPPLVSSHTLILSVLGHLPSAADLEFDLPRVTNSIAELFQTLLVTLHKLALIEVTRRNEEQSSKDKNAESNTKALKKSPEQWTASFALSAALLLRTIQHIVAAFDLDILWHCFVFKSMLSVLLDHTGSIVSLLVFADPTNIEGDKLLEQPGRWRQDFDPGVETTIVATEMEVPYVLAVLRFTLRYLRERRKTLPIGSREIIGGSLTDIDNDMLLQKIEKRLQDTLLRGVFGADDEKFVEAFTRPSTPDNNDIEGFLEDVREEENKPEWFIGQVWELLGWDIISGRMAITE